MDSGRSVSDCTSRMVWARMAGSSASGMPALTSSMWAPASTWASTSRSTRLKSPARISSASSLRPVGLMRSPMTTNGRSSPMTTSRLADETTVRVSRSPARPPVAIRTLRRAAGVGGLEQRDLGRDLGLEVVAAGAVLASPLRQVVVRAGQAGLDGGAVDGILEAARAGCACWTRALPGPRPGPGCRATR